MSNSNNKNFFAVFCLLFGASFWGVLWYPYRILEGAGITGIASSFYTYVVAAIIASILFARHWHRLFTLPKSIVFLAMAAGWTNLSYVLAVIDGQVMRVILLFYLSPLWTLILAHFWLHERTNLKGIFIILVALLGASIMLYDPHGKLGYIPIPQSQSDWLALSSGVGFAVANVITRSSVHLSIKAKSLVVLFGVVAVSLIFAICAGEKLPLPDAFDERVWMVLLLISLVLVAATISVQYGLTHVTANRASVIFLFELVVAAIASYLLAGEVMTINEWIGGLLIVAAALVAATNKDES